MKFLFFVCLLAHSMVFAQSNIYLDDGALVWQKVYSVKLDPEEYKNQMLRSINFESIDLSDNNIHALIRNLEMDYKGAGKNEMNTSMYLSRSLYDAVVIVEFKDDRFRITVKDLKGIQNYSDGLIEKGQMTPIEFWAVKNGSLRKTFIKRDLEIIDHTLDKLVSPKKTRDTDW